MMLRLGTVGSGACENSDNDDDDEDDDDDDGEDEDERQPRGPRARVIRKKREFGRTRATPLPSTITIPPHITRPCHINVGDGGASARKGFVSLRKRRHKNAREFDKTMELGHTIADSKNKYPEITDEILRELREWAEKRGLSQIPDEKFALFAHSCYFNLEDAKRCMKTHYKFHVIAPELLAHRDPRAHHLQHSLRVLQFVELPKPDRNGYRIIFHRLADTRPNQYNLVEGIKLLLMSVEASLYTEGCTPGYIFLFDMQGVRLGHLTRLNLTSIHRFFQYLQDGLPIRLKAIHVLNVVWFMNKILTLIKPFMKRELFEMLHLYSGDVSEVYDHIPPECLPKDFGGELDCVETLHEEHCRKLDNLRGYFLAEEHLICDWFSPEKELVDKVKTELLKSE